MEENILVIPEGTEIIKREEYRNKTEYTGVVFPSSLKEIEARAFSGCKNLKVIDLPKGLTNIGSFAFYDVEAVFFIPSTIKSVGIDAFSEEAVIFVECKSYDFSGSLAPERESSEHPFAFYGYGGGFTYDSDNRPPAFKHYYESTHEDFLKYLKEHNL